MSLPEISVDNATRAAVDDEGVDAPAIQEAQCPVDIILQAPDGTKFGAHTKNLQLFSHGFPPSDSVVSSPAGIINLPEAADVVCLMLRFMHHGPLPDLGCEQVELLQRLAEAAEKYVIYSAMAVCKPLMELKAQSMPLGVLRYAWMHGYLDVADRVAAHTVTSSNLRAAEVLDASVNVAWIRYCEQWDRLKSECISVRCVPSPVPHKGGGLKCRFWKRFRPVVESAILRLPRTPTMLHQAERIVSSNMYMLEDCWYCTQRAHRWETHILGIPAPRFSDLLAP